MAISIAAIAGGPTAGNHGTGPAITGQFTPADNCKLFTVVYAQENTGSTFTDPLASELTCVSVGTTLDWTEVVREDWIGAPAGSFSLAIAVFEADVVTGADHANMQVQADCGSSNIYSYVVRVLQITGEDVVVRQTSVYNDNGVPLGSPDLSVDFSLLPFDDSLLVSAAQQAGGSPSLTTPSGGWSVAATHVTDFQEVTIASRTGPEGSNPSVTWTLNSDFGADFGRVLVSIEVQIADSEIITVDPASVVAEGQNIDVANNLIPVDPAAAAFAGQDITFIDNVIAVTTAEAAAVGQNINIIGGGATLDLMPSLYLSLSEDSYITDRLGTFMSPAIFTRRPIPDEATYPILIVNTPSGIFDQDGLVSRRPVVVLDIIVYGEQDDQYRTVEELAYYLRSKYHRRKDAITVDGYQVVEIVVGGPTPGPTDDFNHVARAVTLTIQLLET